MDQDNKELNDNQNLNSTSSPLDQLETPLEWTPVTPPWADIQIDDKDNAFLSEPDEVNKPLTAFQKCKMPQIICLSDVVCISISFVDFFWHIFPFKRSTRKGRKASRQCQHHQVKIQTSLKPLMTTRPIALNNVGMLQ